MKLNGKQLLIKPTVLLLTANGKHVNIERIIFDSVSTAVSTLTITTKETLKICLNYVNVTKTQNAKFSTKQKIVAA